jgi:hypothetical protein
MSWHNCILYPHIRNLKLSPYCYTSHLSNITLHMNKYFFFFSFSFSFFIFFLPFYIFTFFFNIFLKNNPILLTLFVLVYTKRVCLLSISLFPGNHTPLRHHYKRRTESVEDLNMKCSKQPENRKQT